MLIRSIAAAGMALALMAGPAAGRAAAQSGSFDAGDLSDKLSRTVSLAGTFFGRFDRLVEALYLGRGYDDGIVSVDGVWYDGYGIDTDFGDQTGVLGRVYGDVLVPLAGGKVAALAGVGGYRYGVFLTGIDLPLPSGDPYGTPGFAVTDFAGTQYFQDIYALAVAVRGYGSLTGYYATNSEYAPRAGVLDFQSPVSVEGHAGLRLSAAGVFRAEALLSADAAFERAAWSVDPLGLADLALNAGLGRRLASDAGILWRTLRTGATEALPFSWGRFLAPAKLGFEPVPGLAFSAGAVACSPELAAELGGFLRSAHGLASLKVLAGAVRLEAGASWHRDARLADFSGGAVEAIGFTAGARWLAGPLSLELGARKDWFADLDDLIESYGKWVFAARFAWSAWY